MLKIINITFIVINYKRITMIMIHFDKKRSLAMNYMLAKTFRTVRKVTLISIAW